MTQLEQLKVILLKEIKQKEWMQEAKTDTRCSHAYFAGSLASLRYFKYVLEKMMTEQK